MNGIGQWTLVSYLIEKLHAEGTPTASLITIGGILLCIVIPYLLGSVNFGLIISNKKYNDDIRAHGSGNAGTTNMLRTYGKGAALGTLLGDVIKTAIAVTLASFLMSVHFGGWVAAVFCMMGHIFPIYYRFKGGKGVLCAATAIAFLSPFSFVVAILIFILFVAMSKYVSLGSIVAALFLPLLINFENLYVYPIGGGFDAICSISMALIVVWCHRENIKRIQNRTESKLSFKKKTKDGEETK
jgi:glycerol-3-phosphate acyltransferase PlsY